MKQLAFVQKNPSELMQLALAYDKADEETKANVRELLGLPRERSIEFEIREVDYGSF